MYLRKSINWWNIFGFWNVKKCHCAKCVRIRSFPGLYCSAFELRIFPYSVRIRENTDQKISEYGQVSRSVYTWGDVTF